MTISSRIAALIFLFSISPIRSLAQVGTSSTLVLATSDPALQKTFDWAKTQALAYVGSGTDRVGDWYEAALPGRRSFCMRDVSHQTMGAYALGLAPQNFNMLHQFAKNISLSRDWASYWEIDREGRPSTADYQTDADFWYNLPANFDLMTAALRMYRWTGDTAYINSPDFANFYERTLSDYTKRWNLEPSSVLNRSRIMNQRLQSGKFVSARGIPSYTEGRDDFVVGVDLLAAEYQAFRLAAELARSKDHTDAAKGYDSKALAIQRLIETQGWNAEEHHFYGFAKGSQSFFGDGDALVLYFSATDDPTKIEGALSAIREKLKRTTPGIEEQSYLPEVLYRYGATEEAYSQILDLSRPDRERREYPEVSYSIVGAIVTGMMGIDVSSLLQERSGPAQDARTVIGTYPQLSSKTQWAELDHLAIRNNVIDVRHDGSGSSSLTNVSGPAFVWQPRFAGRSKFLLVNGHKVAATETTDTQGHLMTTANISVPPKTRMVVKMVDSSPARFSPIQ